ncbi:acid-resistance membrane protein [compost metagenome]
MLALADRWWVPTLRGVAAIAFGFLAILWPGLALMTLVVLFGIFALADGIIALAGLGRTQTGPRAVPWGLQLLVGVVGVLAGLLTFVYPGITSVVLLTFIAAYAIVVGISQIVAAVRQRKQSGAFALGAAGVLLTLFGVLVAARPAVGAVTIAWLIGIFAIAAGVALMSMGFTLRQVKTAEPRLVATMLPEEERAKIER